jgi:predicted RecB family nuclease
LSKVRCSRLWRRFKYGGKEVARSRPEGGIMATKIFQDIIESYLNCKYKGHLKLTGKSGTISDYEAMTTAARASSREQALTRLAARFGEGAAGRGAAVTAALLKQGAPFLLDASVEDGGLSLRLDALKRIGGASKVGDHHYIPILHSYGDKVGRREKLLLAVLGLALARIQGLRPASGLIAHGPEARLGKVRLDPKLYRQAEQVVTDLERLQQGGEPPRLVLNDHCQVCEFRQMCHDQAVQEDNLSLLRGIREKEIGNLGRKGIITLTQLAHTFRPKRKGKRQERQTGRHCHALKALAIRDKKIYVLGTPTLPDSPVLAYLDIEGVPDKGFVYLIGLTVVSVDGEERFSLWADSKDQEGEIFERFLDVLSRHDDFRVFCYGGYEKVFLTRMRKQARRQDLADKVLKSLVNVLSLVYSNVYFPCYSNGLKDVAAHLGCTWSDPNASGIQSLVWRAKWEATRNEDWKQKLIAYNAEDGTALKRVTEVVRAVVARAAPDAPPLANPELPPVGFVRDLDKLAHDRKWRRVNFVHPDYEFINNCAYFDYQRERVFVRTSRSLRKRIPEQGKSRNGRLRISRRVTVLSQECPFCKSKELALVPKGELGKCRRQRAKRAFDLVITSSGMRRKVIECRVRLQRCLACGRTFLPEQHERLDKHFHGLKSWAMYQHVAHRLSLGTIGTMFKEFFDLSVTPSEIHMFKSLMAGYYQPTYQGLLHKILSGPLLHIDETEVTLQSGKAYVWVFTNLEEVVFMYRPTREGDFLKELLKDFRGVLVSDFYAAYDSIECPQQKCLIHLMRDMNQDLLNNPFDEELQSITRPFGTLLRSIVTTVDQHGLKRRHLERHNPEVERFFRELGEHHFRSEVAESLRTRVNKHREKLFTFIHHDGVPWNNNNAENAIKRFAYYREDTVGLMKEAGLTSYLVLLSICHTCRYKGVSFLKFLLSREQDVDVFCKGKQQKREAIIETYPKGFIPPHFKHWQTAKQAGESGAAQEQAGPDEQVAQRVPSAGEV